MTAGTLALVVALGVLGVAAVVVARSRAQVGRLRRRLDAASGELEHLQTSFERFAPRVVVERIVAGGVATGAERKEVTILFADLVGFTALAERLAPEVLVRILNDYFGRMSRVVSDHRGHVAKFIGDGLMATFGALEPNPWQTNDAVHAALDMRAALAAYNEELVAEGLPPLRVGVGIHCGPTVAGVIGSPELNEFTVIGSTVNTAARVERLTRIHGADILVTEAVRAAADPGFVLRALPAASVKGLAAPIVTFAVERFARDGAP